jgi:hypothetical protein
VAKQYPRVITLTTTDPNLPLPDPSYLRIHAACARVANLSGAGEHIEKVEREMETTRVLSSDGTSVEILQHALLAKAIAVF